MVAARVRIGGRRGFGGDALTDDEFPSQAVVVGAYQAEHARGHWEVAEKVSLLIHTFYHDLKELIIKGQNTDCSIKSTRCSALLEVLACL